MGMTYLWPVRTLRTFVCLGIKCPQPTVGLRLGIRGIHAMFPNLSSLRTVLLRVVYAFNSRCCLNRGHESKCHILIFVILYSALLYID